MSDVGNPPDDEVERLNALGLAQMGIRLGEALAHAYDHRDAGYVSRKFSLAADPHASNPRMGITLFGEAAAAWSSTTKNPSPYVSYGQGQKGSHWVDTTCAKLSLRDDGNLLFGVYRDYELDVTAGALEAQLPALPIATQGLRVHNTQAPTITNLSIARLHNDPHVPQPIPPLLDLRVAEDALADYAREYGLTYRDIMPEDRFNLRGYITDLSAGVGVIVQANALAAEPSNRPLPFTPTPRGFKISDLDENEQIGTVSINTGLGWLAGDTLQGFSQIVDTLPSSTRAAAERLTGVAAALQAALIAA